MSILGFPSFGLQGPCLFCPASARVRLGHCPFRAFHGGLDTRLRQQVWEFPSLGFVGGNKVAERNGWSLVARLVELYVYKYIYMCILRDVFSTSIYQFKERLDTKSTGKCLLQKRSQHKIMISSTNNSLSASQVQTNLFCLNLFTVHIPLYLLRKLPSTISIQLYWNVWKTTPPSFSSFDVV